MFVYLSKKISIPNNVQLRCISWSKQDGYIACGGDGGLLKVLKLENTAKDGSRSVAAPSNLSINQNLEGHNGAIKVIVWNEAYQKLTTSDQYGYIIVWMMYKGSWYEEMINNRNKSVVTDMAWNTSGTKICIVYEDGVVIVGSVDGNRLWGKEIKASLLAVEWSPNGKLVLFGLANGEVHAYDNEGNFVSKLPVLLEQQLIEGNLSAIEWHCQDPEYYDHGVPSLAFIYRNGAMQLMRHENDQDAVLVQLEKVEVVSAKWCHSGNMLAVAGQKSDLPENEQNVVYFINSFGEHLRTLKMPGKQIAGCSWEVSSLRIALAVDSHIYFANIRPDYKWGYCAQTVIYSFRRQDRNETCIAFWDTKLNETYFKYTRDVLAIACHGDYCVVINKADDLSGPYLLQLCNGIGTPVDFKFSDMEPLHVAMTANHVVVANKDSYYIWQYSVPRKLNRDSSVSMPKRTAGLERTCHIDQLSGSDASQTAADIKRAMTAKPNDPICCITATETILLIARESGALLKFSLPNLTFEQRYSLINSPMKMALNCSNKRLAYISTAGNLRFYDLEGKGQTIVNFERKDVWDLKWDEDNELLIAIMEKARLYVLKGTDSEEPVVTSGYLCRFNDLKVRTALIDDLVSSPDRPQKDWLVDIEIKALRDAKQLLEKQNLTQATEYIEKNPHPKLWNLLAEVALNNVDTTTAEHAFVNLKDYAGIQFIKKVNNIQNETLRKAEIAAYFDRFNDAERMYLESDRRDLALALRKKLGDWFRVLQLLQSGTGQGNDAQLEEASNAVGDYYNDRQKWQSAIGHYIPGRNYEKLAHCYYMLEDYENLEKLMRVLTDNHVLLPRIGDMFANAGLCEQAVEAFTRCNQIKSALDTCIQLNQWDAAIQLARSYDVPDIDNLLAKYAEQLICGDTERVLTAVQLYRKAGRFLDAAKLVFQLADDERLKQARPIRLKQMYVLGALLVEQYHEHNRAKLGAQKDRQLTGLLDEETTNFVDAKLIDNSWRGAEAYHFYILSQRQLYDGNADGAMKTALHLTEYDDIIDPLDIYSLLALSSCAARQFSACSRAFLRLESIESIPVEEREAYEKLALTIFTKFSAKDNRPTKAECTGCETLIPDYCQVCPSCDVKFPICIVTGRPLMDYQFWMCPVCKHRAYEQEIKQLKICPLCHTAI